MQIYDDRMFDRPYKMITQEQLELHRKYLSNEDGGVRLIAIDANLRRADLRRANLRRANLSGANLSDADLRGANLSGAIALAPVTESAILLLLKIAEAVGIDGENLRMEGVHSACGTAHCGAGWTCVLDGTAGAVEKILGWNAAACLACPIPEFTGLFYGTDDQMLEFLRSVSADGGAALRAKYLSK